MADPDAYGKFVKRFTAVYHDNEPDDVILTQARTALRKSKTPARALGPLRTLGRSPEATPDDGYALATLELAAGTTARLNIRVGDKVEQRIFGNAA